MKLHISSAMSDSGPVAWAIPLVGYRFHPTDDELLNQFLKPKIAAGGDFRPPIPEVKVCDYEPWDLPSLIGSIANQQVWYFFCGRDFKSLRNRRINRTTEMGYWKPTGKPRPVFGKHKKLIGTKRTLVFYIRERPKPIRTGWIMTEYECALNSDMANPGNFVLCKLKFKAGEKISECEPDIQSQNLSDMMVNSSCDEDQSSGIHTSSDSTDKSIYEVDKEDIVSQDFGSRDPANSTDISASHETTFDFDLQNQNQVTDMSNPINFWSSLLHFIEDREFQGVQTGNMEMPVLEDNWVSTIISSDDGDTTYPDMDFQQWLDNILEV